MSAPVIPKKLIVWGSVAAAISAIGGALLLVIQLGKPVWAYAVLPARTAAQVADHAKALTDDRKDISELQEWRRKKERRDWKTRWYLEQIAAKNGIPIAPEPRARDLEDQ